MMKLAVWIALLIVCILFWYVIIRIIMSCCFK